MRWLDLYASSDPVSSGPLIALPSPAQLRDRAWWRYFSPQNRYRRAFGKLSRPIDQAEPVNVHSIEIYNRASVILDHTAYTSNVEQVVTPIIDHASSFTKVWPTRARDDYVRRLTDAWTIRRWLVGWLVTMRATFVTQVLVVGIVIGLGGERFVTFVLLGLGVLAWYWLVVARAWRSWNNIDQRAFLRNRTFPSVRGLSIFLVSILIPGLFLTTATLLQPARENAGAEDFWLLFGWIVFALSCSLRQWPSVLRARRRIRRSALALRPSRP